MEWLVPVKLSFVIIPWGNESQSDQSLLLFLLLLFISRRAGLSSRILQEYQNNIICCSDRRYIGDVYNMSPYIIVKRDSTQNVYTAGWPIFFWFHLLFARRLLDDDDDDDMRCVWSFSISHFLSFFFIVAMLRPCFVFSTHEIRPSERMLLILCRFLLLLSLSCREKRGKDP